MFVRLLHAAVALSLAPEPVADAPASDAVDDPASTADEPTEPESETPASKTPATETPESDASAAEPPESDASAAEPPESVASAAEPPESDASAAEPPESVASPAKEPAATDAPATAPPAATEAPRPVHGPAPSGRDNDIVRKALFGGGIASLTLTAGLIGTSAWAWTEHNRAKRAVPNLTAQARVDAEDRQDQMRTIGVVTTAAAVLYGTTGVVLLLLNARDRKQPPRTVLAPSPGGLSLVGRF